MCSGEFFSDEIMAFIGAEDKEDEIDKLLVEILTSILEPEDATSEFQAVGEKELERLIDKNVNANTKHSTKTWINCYRKWATQQGQPPSIASIPPAHLDIILQ